MSSIWILGNIKIYLYHPKRYFIGAQILKSIEKGENVTSSTISLGIVPQGGNKAVFEWAAAQTAVIERDGQARLSIIRHGNINIRAFVK